MTRPGQVLLMAKPGGVGGLIPPIGINPTVLWDARSGLSLSGSSVLSWTDMVRGVVLSPVGAASTRPTYAVDTGNFRSLPVVQFDGADDGLSNTAVSPPLAAAPARAHWFAVLRMRTVTTPCVFWEATTAANAGWPSVLRSGAAVHAYYEGHAENIALPDIGTSQVVIHGYLTSAGAGYTKANAVIKPSISSGADASAPASVTKLSVGAAVAGGSFAYLSIAALGCYSRELSASEIAALEAYYVGIYGNMYERYEQLLGSNLLDMWHASAGMSISGSDVLSWASLRGRTVPSGGPTNKPQYSESQLGCHRIPQTNATAQRFFRGTGYTGLPAVGTLPYLFGVFRMTSSSASGTHFAVEAASGGRSGVISYDNGTTNTRGQQGATATRPGNNTTPHFVELWSDGTTLHLAVDGTEGTAASTWSVIEEATTIGIGSSGWTSSNLDHCAHGLWGICAAAPDATTRANLRALARQDFTF